MPPSWRQPLPAASYRDNARDRAGLYADAAREGAPQARQIADRFHLLKNLRETMEQQLGRFEAPIRFPAPGRRRSRHAGTNHDRTVRRLLEVATQERLLRRGRDATHQAMFDQIRGLYDAGHAVTEIARSWVSVPGASIAGCVASTCQSRVPWRRNRARRPTSGLSWHAVGPKGRPKSGISFLTSVIAATPARTVT